MSSLACKTGFFRPKHKAKGGHHGTNFEGLEMQRWNVSIDIVQIADEKMGSFV